MFSSSSFSRGGFWSWAGSWWGFWAQRRIQPCSFLQIPAPALHPSGVKIKIQCFSNLLLLYICHYKKKKGKKKLGNIFLTLCADTVLCIENFCCFLGAFILLWNNFHVSGRIFFLTNKKNTSQRQQLMEIAEALECFCGGASQIFPYLTENDVRFCTCLSWWVSFHC